MCCRSTDLVGVDEDGMLKPYDEFIEKSKEKNSNDTKLGFQLSVANTKPGLPERRMNEIWRRAGYETE